MNKIFLCCLLVFTVSCYTQTPEEKEKSEKLKAEKRLASEVEPVMEDYFEDCRNGNYQDVIDTYSIQMKRELETHLGSALWMELHRDKAKGKMPKASVDKLRELGRPLLMKHHEQNKEDMKVIGDTAKVVSIKHHGSSYAIVEVEYSAGKQYIALIRQDQTWKIHLVSESRLRLISSIPA